MISRYRNSRIWNINGNIVVASLVAILLTALAIHLIDPMYEDMTLTLVLTAFLDFLFDLGVFAALHAWTKTHRSSFFRDVSLIQTHRLFLSPLFYLVAVPTQAALLMSGFSSSASLLAYVLALLVTRGVHTTYGLWTGLFR